MELEALFDAVIVKPLEEEETTYGSIVVPDLGKDRNEHGTVVAVGPGREVAGIGFVKTIVKEGDVVILPTMGFAKLEHEGFDWNVKNTIGIAASVIGLFLLINFIITKINFIINTIFYTDIIFFRQFKC